ncbi:DUF536 domain-containing protein [Staphylococcus cohnii]|uniref:DUF536 domain-containing protein n=1 Tax=Staphylococcus cohnii TaxID=29382 RepID=UPI001867B656|nr:DUF536 domain-containing protein [Staphylococcus cohnii]
MKSMKQIADELNVTKMTVYNNAKKANVNFQKVDNVNYLSGEDEVIVVNRIKKNQNKNDYFDNEKKEESKPNDDNLVKDETIKHLYNQLDIYKEQSNRDKEQINTLNRLLENQQILALESNKKIQKLENQLEEERQLKYTSNTEINNRQNRDVQEAAFTENSRNINQQQEGNQTTEIEGADREVPRKRKDEGVKESSIPKNNEPSKKMDTEYENSEKTQPKKGFWSRLFGN